MTKVTINDEPTRAVVLHAIWWHAANTVGGGQEFHDEVWECAWTPIHHHLAITTHEDPRAVVDAKVADLLALRDEADRLRTVPLGQEALVSLDADQFAEALCQCRLGIEENSDLWLSLPAAEREYVLRCRDAAAVLMVRFPKREAVA